MARWRSGPGLDQRRQVGGVDDGGAGAAGELVLVQHAGKVLTHRQLLKAVWGPSHVDDNHYLRVYMGNLRQKLEADPQRPQIISNELGIGYRLKQGAD